MEHFFEDIQGWFEEDGQKIYREAVEQAPMDTASTFVELGSWKGRSAAFMAVEIINSNKPITLYCIDHWTSYGDPTVPYFSSDPDTSKAFDIFLTNLSKFDYVVTPMPCKSWEGAHCIGSLVDFIYIDASHEYEDVIKDLDAWLPKMAPGATISGDDFNWPGVWRAVHEVFGLGNVERIGRCWRLKK